MAGGACFDWPVRVECLDAECAEMTGNKPELGRELTVASKT